MIVNNRKPNYTPILFDHNIINNPTSKSDDCDISDFYDIKSSFASQNTK